MKNHGGPGTMNYLLSCIILTALVACGGNSQKALDIYIKGKEAFHTRDLATAEKLFTEALALDSSLHTASLMLSRVHYYNRSWDKAMDSVDKILKDNPYHADALHWKAKLLYSRPDGPIKEQIAEARQLLLRLKELDHYHIQGRALLALIHEREGNYQDAVREYLTILDEEETLLTARANLSILYKRLGLTDRSRGQIATAVAIARTASLPVDNLEKIEKELQK
jgi:tetratricopeptide (TPR) repeat protein